MQRLPLISVYIPTRNRRAQVSQAIQSVLNQDYPSLEVIVVDDGSDDDTPSRLRAWCEHEPRLRYIRHETSRGAPHARNSAIELANGVFVTGLDDDDTFLPTRLSRFVSAWFARTDSTESPMFLYAQSRILRDNGERRTRYPQTASMDALCKHNCIGNQVFAPKSLYTQVGGFKTELPAWQDLDMWMSMLKFGATGFLVDEITMVFDDRCRPDRITQALHSRVLQARDTLLNRHTDLTRSQKRNVYLQAIAPHYGAKLGITDMRQAWRIDPSLDTIKRCLSLWWRDFKH